MLLSEAKQILKKNGYRLEEKYHVRTAIKPKVNMRADFERTSAKIQDDLSGYPVEFHGNSSDRYMQIAYYNDNPGTGKVFEIIGSFIYDTEKEYIYFPNKLSGSDEMIKTSDYDEFINAIINIINNEV